MTNPNGTFTDDKNVQRCYWCESDDLYIQYHDNEWGRPCHDDRTLFEKICLEGFQAGLSWITILRKRENFRKAFANFNPEIVATYTQENVQSLLQNQGIIRHRGKIEATINNAKRTLELQQEFGSFDAYIWQFKPEHHTQPKTLEEAKSRTTSPQAIALSKDLKKRGWKFVGPTTCYAFMQAMGLVNDHMQQCFIKP